MGHIKENCHLLNPTGAIQAPKPTNLRISDAQHGSVEAPRDRGQAFQLTIEDEREAPEVIVGCSLE